jgi:hypothetical protein
MNKTYSRVFFLFVFIACIPVLDLKSSSGTHSVGSAPMSPEFSVDHGFFNAPFFLGITSSAANVRVFYTSDGSTPDVNNGLLYTVPVRIDHTSVIRAVCIGNDLVASKTTTRTYLFPDNIIHQVNNPDGYPSEWAPFTSINGVAPGDYEMDPEMMADPQFEISAKEALLDLPVISLVTDKDNLFSKNVDQLSGGIYIYTGVSQGLGYGWERPVSFEYFSATDTGSFQVDCGIQIQGGEGRRPEKSPKHSFLIVFKNEYGPSKLKYPFFGNDAVSIFNKIILRAGFGNTWIHWSHSERSMAQYIRDRWTKDTQRAMGHYSSHGNYVHLFINGLYWGLYNPSERMDSDFAESYLYGNKDDFDVIKDYSEAVDGDAKAWNTLIAMANAGLKQNDTYQLIRGNNPDGTPNPEIEAMVDVVSLADYMILNFYGGNWDWDHHNWVAIRNRVTPCKGFRFFCWDAEHMVEGLNANILSENNDKCPSRIFQQLRQNEEFLRLFADRVQKFCFNNGALTPASAAGRWALRAGQIDKAVIAESARWGDYRRDVHQYQTEGPFDLYNREDYWLPQLNYILNTYFPGRTEVFISQLRKAKLFPSVDAPVYQLNGNPVFQNKVKPGDILALSSGNGNIWYTTDGGDPAVYNSVTGISSSAQMYLSPITINESTHLKARTFYNGTWSALSELSLLVTGDFSDLKITEIHYHPVNQNGIQDSVFEFIELKNTGTSTLNLEEVQFTEGIRYRFPSESYLRPQEFVVLASNSRYFYELYNFMPFDQYNGQLDNGGEELVLLSPDKDTLCYLTYDDENDWPLPPDGEGKSLVPIELNPSGDQKLPSSWRSSYNIGGSPGADDIYSSGKLSSEIITVYQNYPNPFSEITTIPYQLHSGASVKITVFNLSGKPVIMLENVNRLPGYYRTEWDGFDKNGSKVPTGIYFCRIEATGPGGKNIMTKKIMLIRK